MDEFLGMDRYVNSWAPVFTHLRDKGLIEATGETRLTRHGSPANVWAVTTVRN